jgi:hypothetical protein
MKGSPRFILSESWSIFEVRIDVDQLGSMATAPANICAERCSLA